MRYYLVAAIVLAFDQLTKWLVVTYMDLYEAIPVIGEFFQIYSHRNRGAAFGILQEQRWFFVMVTVVVVAGIVWYLRKTGNGQKPLFSTALGLLLGGAVGNLVDRMRAGEVVDFMKFRFQFDWFGGREIDYTFAVFNMADSAIVIAVGLILLDAWRSRKSNREETLTDEPA